MRVPFLALLSSSSAKESTLQLQHQELAHVDAELANTVGNSMNQGSDVERTGPKVEGEGVQTALRFSDSDAVAVYKGIAEGLYRDKDLEAQIQTTCVHGVRQFNDAIRKVFTRLQWRDEIQAKRAFQEDLARVLKRAVYTTFLACGGSKFVDLHRMFKAIRFMENGRFEYNDGKRIKINGKDITGEWGIAVSYWPQNYSQFGLYLGKVLDELAGSKVEGEGVQPALPRTRFEFSNGDAVAVYKGIVEGLYRDKRVEGQIQRTCLRGVDKWNDVIRKVKGALMIPDEIGAKFTFQREFSRMLKQTVYDTLLACNCDKIVDVSRLRIAIYFIQFGPFEYKDGRIKINYKDITGDLKIALSNWPRNYNQFGLYLGKVLKQLSPPPVPVKGKAAEAVEEEAVLIA